MGKYIKRLIKWKNCKKKKRNEHGKNKNCCEKEGGEEMQKQMGKGEDATM